MTRPSADALARMIVDAAREAGADPLTVARLPEGRKFARGETGAARRAVALTLAAQMTDRRAARVLLSLGWAGTMGSALTYICDARGRLAPVRKRPARPRAPKPVPPPQSRTAPRPKPTALVREQAAMPRNAALIQRVCRLARAGAADSDIIEAVKREMDRRIDRAFIAAAIEAGEA